MTIGEKIKHYRTSLGLSQEELGQKLLVSRQTVSLWENGQTVPTIDNLIRLKDIFGVTVDEILNCEDSPQEKMDAPIESYNFTYIKEDLTDLYKYSIKATIRKISFPITILLLAIVYVFFNSTSVFIKGLLIGMLFLFIISYVKGFISYRKTWINSQKVNNYKSFEFKVFNDFIKINVFENNEVCKAFEFKLFDIQKIFDTPKFFILTIAEQSFLLRKSDLPDNSVFYSFINENPSKLVHEKPIDLWDIISLVLFAGSIISFFVGFIILGNIKEPDSLSISKTWILWLFIPIPVSSIIYGFVLKKKRLSYAKNMVVGIVMTILLCIFGSFSLLFSTLQNKCTTEIARIEQTTGIDIPTYTSISIGDKTIAKQDVPGVKILFTSDIFFIQEAVTQFEYDLSDNLNWIAFVPEYLYKVSEPLGNTNEFTDIMLYNISEDTINSLPNQSGKSHYIALLYNGYNNHMRVIEYEIDYIQ